MPKLPVHAIGFGPALVGFLVAADRLGCLPALIARGFVIHEAATPGQLDRSGMCYDITSNTPGQSFVAPIRSDGIFAPALSGTAGLALRAAGVAPVPLTLAAEFMADLRAICLAQGAEIRWQSRVESLRQTVQGWHVGAAGLAGEVILATGSAPFLPPDLANRDGVIHAEEYLRPGGEARLQADGPVCIIGASHSAISSLGKLLARGDGREVTLLSRAPVRRSWPNEAAALAAGEAYDPATDICPTTGTVHLLAGLHADAKDLWTEVLENRHPQVRWQSLTAVTRLPPGPIIAATGYRPRLPRLLTAEGREIFPPLIGSRLASQDPHWPRDRLHLIGHGLGHRPPQLGEPSSTAGLTSFAWFAGPDGQGLCQRLCGEG